MIEIQVVIGIKMNLTALVMIDTVRFSDEIRSRANFGLSQAWALKRISYHIVNETK